MALIATRNCPHCRTQRVAFTARVEWAIEGIGNRALLLCGSCGEGVIFQWIGSGSLIQSNGDVDKRNIILGRQWPEPQSGHAPEDTPATVANYFEQGTSSLDSGHFDAAGLMFRKSLESATKILDPSSATKPLVKRIESLISSGALTKDMGIWAHEVRLGGNDAAHEDEPFTVEEALGLRNFIENFLRYAFTLPSAVEKRSAVQTAS